MQLKASTDYGIRATLYLATQNRVCSSKDIAEDMAIPRDYLIQLAQQLRNAGIIKAHPGKHGGYSLAKNPSEISLLDIMTTIDIEANQTARLKRNARAGEGIVDSIKQAYNFIEESMDAFLASITVEMVLACAENIVDSKKLLSACFRKESQRLASACA